MRRFEVVNKQNIIGSSDVKMPKRATKHSCGYDFYSPVDVNINPGESMLVFTNIKAQFAQDEALFLFVTSKMGKRHIVLANGTGLVDCDYYGNQDNDGNIGFRLLNLGNEIYQIKQGDKIGQGVFMHFLTVDDEEEITVKRTGGFGSTSTGFSN